MAVKVYAIWSHPLFRDLIIAILTHPDIKWVGDSSDIDTAAEDLANLMPNIILVEEELMLTKALIRMVGILDSVIFINMNMENDSLVLYNQEKRHITDIEEIQQLILNLSR